LVSDWSSDVCSSDLRLGRPYWAMVPRGVRRGVRQVIGTLPQQVRRVAERTFMGVEPGVRNLFLENFAVFPEQRQRRLLRHAQLKIGRASCRERGGG